MALFGDELPDLKGSDERPLKSGSAVGKKSVGWDVFAKCGPSKVGPHVVN
jgi:hypothetical protein